jgi:hypothetical protein
MNVCEYVVQACCVCLMVPGIPCQSDVIFFAKKLEQKLDERHAMLALCLSTCAVLLLQAQLGHEQAPCTELCACAHRS